MSRLYIWEQNKKERKHEQRKGNIPKGNLKKEGRKQVSFIQLSKIGNQSMNHRTRVVGPILRWTVKHQFYF